MMRNSKSGETFFRPVLIFVMFILLAGVTVTSAWAADAEKDSSFYIGEVVIEATPEDYAVEDILDQPVQTTVIRREDFQDKFTSLSDVLAEQAGVEIKTQGGLGSYSTVAIRGVAANQVLILMDGVPLNLGLGGAVNVGDLPLKNLERIEIYRGQAPAKFGVSSIGGVVNLVTRKVDGEVDGDTSLSLGSYNTKAFDMFLRSNLKKVNYSLSLLKQSSDGDYEYYNDRGTPFNVTDDVFMSRSNNDFSDLHFVANGEYTFGTDKKLIFGDRMSSKDQGVPGPANAPSLYAELKTYNHIIDMKYSDPGAFGGNTEAGVEYQWHKYETKFDDTFTNNGEIGLDRQKNRNTTIQNSVTTSFTAYNGLNHELYGSIRFSKEHYQPRDKLQALQVGLASRRSSWTSNLEYRYRTESDNLLAVMSLGHESVKSTMPGDKPSAAWLANPSTEDSESVSNYSGGLRWRASRRITLRSNAGQYYRLPSFYELFGDRGGVIGNSDLLPEKGKSYDLGVSFAFHNFGRPGHFDLTYYYQDVRNVIVFVQNSQFVAYPVNLRDAKINGLETSFEWEVLPGWTLSSNYTLQDTENGGDPPYARGKSLPGRYEYSLDARVEWRIGKFKSYYHFDNVSETYLDIANFNPVPERELHNAGVSYSSGKWTFSVDGKNLADDFVSDINGFPLPGRSLFFTTRREF